MKRQVIQFAQADDGVRLAYGLSGSGPIMVKCANWLNHLEFDWDSPVWKHWFEFFSGHFTLLRYDERGCGLSDRSPQDMSFEAWVKDLETVVDANQLERFPLLGISQGASVAIEYAFRHPERVSQLILHGGFARGRLHRDDQLFESERLELELSLVKQGWEGSNKAFRQVFSSLFVPDGSSEHWDWFAELCRRTANKHDAQRIVQLVAEINVLNRLEALNVPTLVIHPTLDEVVPVEESKLLTMQIDGAQFVQLESKNHLLLAQEPAWQTFCDAVLNFMGVDKQVFPGGQERLKELTEKERQVLGFLGDGLTNNKIAESLFVSEKTVRNHVSRIYEKLAVGSRGEAIVLIRTLRQQA